MLKKTFSFKSPDCKSAKVTIELKADKFSRYIFSAAGELKLNNGKEYYGQCLDIMSKYINDDKFKIIFELWQKYHLNDMHAGTPEQEQALKDAVKKGLLPSAAADYYKQQCEYLKSINLYEVNYEGQPYKYGHAWLYYEIPREDIKRIKAL